MIIGVPKEVKDHEFRVSLTPDGVQALCAAGHAVWVDGARVGSPVRVRGAADVMAMVLSMATTPLISGCAS